MSGLLIFYKLGTKSLTTWDELFYAQSSKEILSNGHWLTTFQFNKPMFDKPPLYMALTSLSYYFFGVHEWSTRLFSALFGMGVILITYLFTKKLYSRSEGIMAALLLLSCVHFFNYTRLATLDMALTFFVCLSMYLFYLGFSKPIFHVLTGFSLAAGILTKGLGGLMPLFIFSPYIIFSKNLKVLKNYSFLGGLLIGFAIPALWIFHEYRWYGNEFISGVFLTHFSRAYQTLDQHTGSLFMYFNVIFYKGKLFAGLALLISFLFLILHFMGHFTRHFTGRFLGKKRDERLLLPLVWIFVVLILFSLTKTKLHWYIIPIYPPLFMILSVAFHKCVQQQKILYVLSLISLLFLGYYQYLHPDKYNDDSNLVFKKIGQKIREIKRRDDKLFFLEKGAPIEERAVVFYSDMFPEDIHQVSSETTHAIIVTDRGSLHSLVSLIQNSNPEIYEIDDYRILRM